jgi:two-component system, LytTR family, response regulator
MINTIIIDDEAKSRQIIREFLVKYCHDIHVTHEAASGEEAYELIISAKPDLVFLDIEMPYENGLDFLKRFDRIFFEIIFITAYQEYAIQAIRACALDYLLKPLSIAELKEATTKAAARIAGKQSEKQYELLLQNIRSGSQTEHHKLAIPTHDGLEFIDQKDIISLEADGSYTNIKLSGGKRSLSTRSLKEYEDILPASTFLRVHHSHMINLAHIKQYHKGEGGYVVMSDSSTVDISKRKKKEFMDRFGL